MDPEFEELLERWFADEPAQNEEVNTDPDDESANDEFDMNLGIQPHEER